MSHQLKFYLDSVEDRIHKLIQHFPHTVVDTIEECDYIVSGKITWGCINPSLIQEVLNSYEGLNKKVLVFMVSDYNEPFHIPSNVLFFRTGMYKSQKKPNEYLLPYLWGVDDMKGAATFSPLPKIGVQPIIGFCGSILSHPSRVRCINRLKMTPDIRKVFITKTDYWGGNPGADSVINEFLDNIRKTYFTLSTRGAGNWSARFYQVLYLGRIPVVVNTDLVMPFEDRINWRDSIVLCDSENDISDRVRQFWVSRDIVQSQIRCKEIYESYFNPAVWCKIIYDEVL